MGLLGKEKLTMLKLELIIKDLKAKKKLRSKLMENHASHSVIRYYDGMIETYEKILKGDYNKK